MTVVIVTLLAGGLGALARYGVTLAAAGRATRIPLAVLIVNIAGSALAGVLVALAEAGAVPPELRTVLVTGLCGGLTTFSTFSVETVQLFLARKPGAALANVLANLGIGVAAGVLGWLVAHALVG